MNLRYGINPEQSASASLDSADSPVRLIHGHPSYINLLDALNAWQLVSEASDALQRPVAASFKHVSPAGVATDGPIDAVAADTFAVGPSSLSPVAAAFVRARDCDPKSSFGDFVAVSHPVDATLATVLATVVSDGIIAPGYEPGTIEVLAAKKGGQYLVLEARQQQPLPPTEIREVFGVRLKQETRRTRITRDLIEQHAPGLPVSVVDDCVLGMIAARFTQSNSVTYTRAAQVVGIGAGQQSRVDCTKLAGGKVDTWWLRRHPKVTAIAFRPDVRRQERINWQIRFIEGDMARDEHARFAAATTGLPRDLTEAERTSWIHKLTDVVLASDGYIPFRDNLDHATRHGVSYLLHPGGSARAREVDEAATEHGITIVDTGVRLFHH